MPMQRLLCALIVVGSLLPSAGCAMWGRNKPVDDIKPSDPDDPSLVERLSPTYMRRSFKKAIGAGPDQAVARELYAKGEALFKEKKYKEAAAQFREVEDRAYNTALEEDAMFMNAEALFFDDQYYASFDKYVELVGKYTNTRHMDKVVARQFAIGRYWEQMDEKHNYWPLQLNVTDKTRPWWDTEGNAMYAYEQVRLNDPRGPYADASIMATANAMFFRKRYEDADYYYGLLRTEYPNSRYQVQAHLLGLQCKLRKYQGAEYEGKPLEEAETLIDQMLTQFPRQLDNERENLTKTKAQVRAHRALRDYTVAKHYDDNARYGAAKHYYKEIIKEFPRTEFAELSQKRIEALAGQPDKPADNFQYINDVFDRGKRKRDEEVAQRVDQMRIAKAQKQQLEKDKDTAIATQPDSTKSPQR